MVNYTAFKKDYNRKQQILEFRKSIKECWVEWSVFAIMFTIPLAGLSILV